MFTSACSLSSTASDLDAAVKSRDAGTIVRAFHDAIYDLSAEMDEALPAVRKFLDYPDPFVRVRAAETLYTAGDHSGFPALVALVKSPDPQMDDKQDLRIKAGRVLAKFRERQAAMDVFDLYRRTKGGGLLEASVTLGAKESLSAMSQYGYVQNEFSIERYARICPPEFLSKLIDTLSTATEPATKNAAAYALARLTADQGYIEYLAQAAQPAIDAKPRSFELNFNDSTKALRYLGSIDHPIAREVLERALKSTNHVAIQYAVVNLLFNQPGRSPEATKVLLEELRGGPSILGVELAFQIAAKLDDPEVRSAGAAYDQRTGNKFWHEYAITRKAWPIYNWIDDYVEDFHDNGAKY